MQELSIIDAIPLQECHFLYLLLAAGVLSALDHELLTSAGTAPLAGKSILTLTLYTI